MFEVFTDRKECQGYGNCVMEAPDTFDLDDTGLVVVLPGQPNEEDRRKIDAAVRSCPVHALSVSE